MTREDSWLTLACRYDAEVFFGGPGHRYDGTIKMLTFWMTRDKPKEYISTHVCPHHCEVDHPPRPEECMGCWLIAVKFVEGPVIK